MCPAPLCSLNIPTSSTPVATEWYMQLQQSDIFGILGGFSDMHTLDDLGDFACVLKVNMEIWTSWFAGFCRVFCVKWIENHFQRSPQAAWLKSNPTVVNIQCHNAKPSKPVRERQIPCDFTLHSYLEFKKQITKGGGGETNQKTWILRDTNAVTLDLEISPKHSQ